VYAIPHAHIVNAAYTHPNESGSRFNDHTRGAWYAADRQKASIAEVVFHKSKRLSDIIVPHEPSQRPPQDVSTYDDWLADFQADFHVLHPPEDFSEVLQPEPVPQCYATSQALARHLLNEAQMGWSTRASGIKALSASCVCDLHLSTLRVDRNGLRLR
jgi:hypothetical protein